MGARVTEEALLGYGFGVQQSEEPAVDPRDGQALHNGDGSPKMIPVWTLIFIDQATGHTVRIPFTEDAKKELVQHLTGGIVVASAGNGGIA